MAQTQARSTSPRPAPSARLTFDDEGRLVKQNALAIQMLGEYAAKTPIGDIIAGASGRSIPLGQYLVATRTDGVPLYLTGSWNQGTLSVKDRTEAYHRQEHQNQVVQLLEDAQRLGQLGSWSWDVAPDVVTWSDEMFRLFGLPVQSEDIDFARYLSLIHPDDRDQTNETIMHAFKEGGMYTIRHRVALQDGSIRFVFGQGMVEFDAEGNATRIWGTCQDVTGQEEALEAQRLALLRGFEIEHLKELDRAKTQLLNTASHELNTPLTPLKLQLHLLTRNQDGLSKTQKKALAVLSRNVQRLAMLVADVLDVARITSGHLKVLPRPTETATVVKDSLAAFDPTANARGITLVNNVTGHNVFADPDRLGQVLDNLLSNALKFTPEGGTVTIGDGLEGEYWCIEVRDTGMGLKEEQIAQLFEPFSQVHDVTQVTERGTGLGLYICRGIAEGHGGFIKMQSDGPGKGTAVRMCIPKEGKTVQNAANEHA